jgi:hypothetical protein
LKTVQIYLPDDDTRSVRVVRQVKTADLEDNMNVTRKERGGAGR